MDGALGAIEDAPDLDLPIGLESSLDFDAAWPLIYPQGTVLFQQDDEWYESTGNFNGFWNSRLRRTPSMHAALNLTTFS